MISDSGLAPGGRSCNCYSRTIICVCTFQIAHADVRTGFDYLNFKDFKSSESVSHCESESILSAPLHTAAVRSNDLKLRTSRSRPPPSSIRQYREVEGAVLLQLLQRNNASMPLVLRAMGE